jgi:plastocyanin
MKRHYTKPLATAAWMMLLGSGTFACAAPAPSAVVAISIRDFMFEPATVMVSAGTVVLWTNRDDDAHTVVSDDGVFRSSALDTGESFRFVFAQPGTYHFSCSLHRRMIGTVVVK